MNGNQCEDLKTEASMAAKPTKSSNPQRAKRSNLRPNQGTIPSARKTALLTQLDTLMGHQREEPWLIGDLMVEHSTTTGRDEFRSAKQAVGFVKLNRLPLSVQFARLRWPSPAFSKGALTLVS